MSGMLAVKLRRDVQAIWPRLLAMVIAIAVSLTVFGAVLYAWSASSRETRSAYLSTEPASATLVLDQAVEAEQMATIAAATADRPGVVEATARTQFTSDVTVNGRPTDLELQVFVATPDDPMRMANFDVQGPSWPPSPGEIFIGRDSLALLDVAVGDVVTVTTPAGDATRLRVSGTVYDPSLAPAPQEQRGHAYLSSAALATPAGDARLDQLKIQVAEPGEVTPSRERDAIVSVAGATAAWLQDEYGLAIREIQVPEPYEHPHQGQADALLISLLVGGAAALLLSTILVANMLNGLFTRQIPQIGILKAIGARSRTIGRHYLAMTLVVAASATLLALVPVVLIGRAGVSGVLGFLGIEPTSLAAPGWTYVVVLAAGLGLPPLMALIPLVKTSRTTVRQAIDHHGLTADQGAATGFLSRLVRVRRLDRGLLMALRNTVRRPARFMLSAGLLASAGTVFVAGMSLGAGTEAVGEEAKAQRSWDVEVQLATPAPLEEIIPIVNRVAGVNRVEGWNRAQSGVAGPGQIPLTRTYPDQGHGGVSVTAIPDDSTMLPPPTLLEGRWLKPGETGAVVLNQVTRSTTLPGVQAGDLVQLFVGGRPTRWRVVGIAQERTGGSGGAYVTADGLAEATSRPQQVNQLRIATDTHDEQTRDVVADAVEGTLATAGVEVTSAASVSRGDAATEGHLGPILMILLAIAIAMALVGTIGLASTMSANVLERTREFGVMKAIGARPKAVRRIVIGEGVFLALASCVLAVLPTLGLTAVLGTGLGNLFMDAPLPYRISIVAVVIWTVIVIVGSWLATDAAATRASRITVREALAYL